MMAPTTAAQPERRVPSPSPVTAEQRRALRVVRQAPKRRGRARHRAWAIGPGLVLLALLSVAAGQTVLTEGQVNLGKLQSSVATAQTQRLDLELQVAEEEQPGAVVAAATRDGMVAPARITELPAVDSVPQGSLDSTKVATSQKKSSRRGTGASTATVKN